MEFKKIKKFYEKLLINNKKRDIIRYEQMASRKRIPCDFCEEENWWTEEGSPGHQMSIEVYPFNNILSITSFANTETGESNEISVSLEMNYCPKCGRKLV